MTISNAGRRHLENKHSITQLTHEPSSGLMVVVLFQELAWKTSSFCLGVKNVLYEKVGHGVQQG